MVRQQDHNEFQFTPHLFSADGDVSSNEKTMFLNYEFVVTYVVNWVVFVYAVIFTVLLYFLGMILEEVTDYRT